MAVKVIRNTISYSLETSTGNRRNRYDSLLITEHELLDSGLASEILDRLGSSRYIRGTTEAQPKHSSSRTAYGDSQSDNDNGNGNRPLVVASLTKISYNKQCSGNKLQCQGHEAVALSMKSAQCVLRYSSANTCRTLWHSKALYATHAHNDTWRHTTAERPHWRLHRKHLPLHDLDICWLMNEWFE